jgi:hypothetical protein
MRLRLSATLLTVAGASLLLADLAMAQIQFIPGPPRRVSRGPAYAAIGDMNNDGINDAVVSTRTDDQIVVLLSNGEGGFFSVVTLPVGRQLRDPVVTDVNLDRYLDIVVVDQNRLVFTLIGLGNASFANPMSFSNPSGAQYLASGNFDRQNGPDLVVSNGTRGSLSPYYNRGGNRGFEPRPIIGVGRNVSQVGTSDFNADLYDDIAVLSTGAVTGADEVAILMNTGNGTFPERPQYFVVGQRSQALTIDDFNNDGAPDIAVLNTLSTSPNTFTISALLNITTVRPIDNRVVGTGFFQVLRPFNFSCPSQINGIPIGCTPQDMKSGDFNGDGVNDLAVSVATASQNNIGVTTPGLIVAFQGNGDGTFEFATQVRIGTRPRGIAVGDVTDDGTPDVVVTEFGDNNVRILASVPPNPSAIGSACRVGTQCLTGNCVDGACCESAACPGDQRCDIPGHRGVCAPPGSNGDRCDNETHCNSNFCVDGFCCGQASCPPFQYCNSGTCAPPTSNGVPCSSGEQCESGFCTEGVCCGSPQCPSTQSCAVPGFEGTCVPRLQTGSACTVNTQCVSGFCVDGACCQVESCPEGQSCNVAPNQGVCRDKPPPTATFTATGTATSTPTPTPSPTPQPNGFQCTNGSQCQSNFCVNGICCGSSACQAPQRCDIFGFAGMCTAPGGNGQECRVDTDCASNNCEAGTPPRCAAARTPTPTATFTQTPSPTPLGNGFPCNAPSECQSRNCVDGFCCNRASCPAGEFCDIVNHEGTCFPPPRQGGEQCIPGVTECEPGTVCNVDNVCCDTDTCPAGQRCDIYGAMGFCSNPLAEGEQCEKNVDCQAGLECRFDPITRVDRCQVPRTPTPTLIPPPIPTATAGLIVNSSRSGGCAIDGSGDARGGWLLMLVPVAFWARRRLVTSRRRSH